MAVRTIFCTECGEKRRARLKDGEVVPYRQACPNCGSEEFRDAVVDAASDSVNDSVTDSVNDSVNDS